MTRYRKSIDVEDIGLDRKFFEDEETLNSIAMDIESFVRSELEKIFGPRLNQYFTTIGVEFDGDKVTVSIDLEVEAYIPSSIDLGKILDKVIRSAFDRSRILLSKYRKAQ